MNNRESSSTADGCGSRWTYSRRGYAFSQSLRQLKLHRVASAATLLALGITLALPAILYFAYPNLKSLGQGTLRGESLTAYLQSDVPNEAGVQLAQSWASRADIERTDYISKEQALAMLGEVSDIRSAIEMIGENPLPGAIVVYPQTSDVTSGNTEVLAKTLREMPQVERVQMDLRWVKRLAAVVSLISWIGGLLAAFLTLSALLVIANTIRLELSRRRAELEVAHLLGAPQHFMNRPILYTGALYGLLGGIIACIIGLIALNTVQNPADTLSSLFEGGFTMKMPTASQIFLVLALSVALGLIGTFSSLYRKSQQLTYQR